MSGTILVRGAKQLLTLRGPEEARRGPALSELGIIRDGALLIKDGRIVEVGLTRRLENLGDIANADEIDVTGRVVMPGFVDSHTHLINGGYGNVSAHWLETNARQFVNGMARHGTTSLEASTSYSGDLRSELKILRAHAKLDRAPLDVISTYWSVPDNSNTTLAAIQRKSLARFAGLDCGSVFDAAQGRDYLEAARQLGFRLKVHAGPYAGGEAVRLAVEAGALSVDCIAASERLEVELLSKSGAIAVLLPGSGVEASARELIDGGAAIALGTHFTPQIGPTYSMQTVVAMACAHLRMTAEEAISAATYNAACALGLSRTAGSLETGKAADFIVLNATDYREIPRQFGVNLVHSTVKRGVPIYLEGRVALH